MIFSIHWYFVYGLNSEMMLAEDPSKLALYNLQEPTVNGKPSQERKECANEHDCP